MGRFVTTVAVAFVALVVAGAALSYGAWRTVGKASASGEFAAAAANGDAKHPHQMAVRLTGRGVSGFAAVACTKGFGVGSKTTTYHGAGLHLLRLPMTGSDTCTATASVSGSGRVTVAILAR